MSPVRTFGFDVVMQLDEALASRLLAARTYDLARVPGGRSPLDVLSVGTPQAPSYVECGMPRLFVAPGERSDVVHLELPLIATAGVPNLGGRSISCEVGDIHVEEQDGAIAFGPANVDAAAVILRAIQPRHAADGLGATADAGGIALVGEHAGLQAAVAAALCNDVPPVPCPPVPFDAAARGTRVGAFCRAAEPAGVRRCGGISVGLHAGAPPAVPLASAIPDSPCADPYNFALVIAADVLGGVIEANVRERLTPTISVTLASQAQSFAMPGGVATVTPPDASGLVIVRAAFTPGDAGRELVVVHGADRSVVVLDADGVAQLSVAAAIGTPMTIAIDGLVKTGTRTQVVLRPGPTPTCTSEGVRLRFVGAVRDVDGRHRDDLTIDVLLRIVVDGSQQARLTTGTPKLIEVQGEPGLEFLAWFMGEGFVSTIGVGVLEDLHRRIVDAMVGRFRELGPVADGAGLTDAFAFVAFFEALRLGSDGLTITGRADAGIYHASGRRRVSASARRFALAGGGVHHLAAWTATPEGTLQLGFGGPHGVIVEGASKLFWRATYDETVQADYDHAAATLAPGGTIAFVIDGGPDLTKVLVERGAGDDADVLVFSWISWVKRAQRGVTLRFSVGREVVETVKHPMFTVRQNAYHGAVECETSRITLNADTLAGAPATGYREHWYWDGHPLQPGVVHEFAGGRVVLDAEKRRIAYDIDPRDGDATKMAFAHEAHFAGVDALGRAFEDTVLIPTPVFAYVRQPHADARRWRGRALEDPRRDLDFCQIDDPRVRAATVRAQLEALVGHMETLLARKVAADGPEMNAAIARALGIADAAGMLPSPPDRRGELREHMPTARLDPVG